MITNNLQYYHHCNKKKIIQFQERKQYKRDGKFLKFSDEINLVFSVQKQCKTNPFERRIKSIQVEIRNASSSDPSGWLIAFWSDIRIVSIQFQFGRKFHSAIRSIDQKRFVIPLLPELPPLQLMFHFHKALRNMKEGKRGWEISKLSLISSSCFHGGVIFKINARLE